MPYISVPVSRLTGALLALAVLLIAPPVLAATSPAVEPGPAGLRRLNQQINAASHRLEVVVEQYNDIREDLRLTVAQATALTRQIDPLRRAMDTRQAHIGALAAGAYRAGGPAAASTMLAAASAKHFADRLLYIERLANEQRRAIANLAQARDRYESARRALGALASQQRTLQARLAIRKRQVEGEIARLRDLRQRAYGLGLRDPAYLPGSAPRYSPGRAGQALRFAHAQLGKPYRYAASGPDAYDCSGLTSAAWRAAGVELPHNAARQRRAVAPISRAELRQGDLVFYYRDIHHVGIYRGDGKIIHAPRYGERVRVEDMDYAPIHGYGRPG